MTRNHRRFAAFFFVLTLLSAVPSWARDAFVLLSGGGSPQSNAYSQYLQAQAMSRFFQQNYPRDAVWVFFGVGNREGEAPAMADVYRRVKRDDGTLEETWLPGALADNRPARRDAILQALREEILPRVHSGGTLYLFVGDHGVQSKGEEAESEIVLWQMNRDPNHRRGWRNSPNEMLGVAELRRVLAEGLGKGRVVFSMTQCHSGGFHYLGVPAAMRPNTRWFSDTPRWVDEIPQYDRLMARAAGFTATDENSLAAGCDPDPDPDRWAGYERYVPENLLGIDLFTQKSNAKPLLSFYDAHVQATLVDRTIDKPYATSEQYLERWADLIEKRLTNEPNLTPRVKEAVALYQRAVDGKLQEGDRPRHRNSLLQERAALFERFTARMIEQNSRVEELLRADRAELERTVGPPPSGSSGNRTAARQQSATDSASAPRGEAGIDSRTGSENSSTSRPSLTLGAAQELWNKRIATAWRKALNERELGNLHAAVQAFERDVTQQEANGRAVSQQAMIMNIYWHAGYGDYASFNPERAQVIGQWVRERRMNILSWAKGSKEESLRLAAETFEQSYPRHLLLPRKVPGNLAPVSGPSPKIAAERILFYRRVLGAWQFLLAVEEKPALNEIDELTELERTPLPRIEPRRGVSE